jgi:prevent-host-death family protein
MAATELVTTLKRNATRIIAEVQQSQEPVLITQHGLPAAYLVDIKTFEALESRIEVLEGIARGEVAIRDGRVLSHSQAKLKMKRWLK